MNLNKKFVFIAVFVTILFIGSFLRLYKLSSFPVGFHIDEASLGYNGYSLLMTGKDENNNRFPLYIDMFGDNRPSGYHYLPILPIKMFGLSEFSTRLPGAFFGILTVFAIFFLTYVIFNDKKISLLSSLLIALAPWHVNLSRASAETIVALFFIILGFAFLIKSLRKIKIKYLILGSLMLFSSLFFYHTPRVFIPILFLTLLFFFRNERKNLNKRYKTFVILAFLFISISSSALVFLVNGGSGRFSQVNIFGYPETKLVMEEQIREDGVSGTAPLVTRFFHNKGINYFLTYVANYFDYFSGNFLFIKGGLPIWYVVPNMGLLYLVELPFILFGIFLLLFDKDKTHKIPLLWLILSPIVAALTVDDIPNIQRAIVMFPALEIIAAYGFIQFFNKVFRHKKVLLSICIILFIFNISYFLHQYFVHAKVHKPWYRDNGFAEMLQIVRKSYNDYDKIIVTKSVGGMYPLVLFYMQYNPLVYQSEGSPKDKEYSGFGKFFFVPMDCPSIQKDGRFPKVKRTIYIDRGNCPGENSKEVIIYKEDKTKAFRIVYGNSVEKK